MNEAADLILQFEKVSIGARPPYDTGLEEVSFTARAGELILVETERDQPRFLLSDAAEGLVEPDRGRVIFEGEDWLKMDPDRAAEARGRIGRVFKPAGWISNLNVDENITLAQRHHSRRPEAEIFEEADRLARGLGLAEVPKLRPALLTAVQRGISETIRAFVGQPRLIILESPMEGAPADMLLYLVKTVEAARGRGSAVLWISSDPRILRPGATAPTRRLHLRNARLETVS